MKYTNSPVQNMKLVFQGAIVLQIQVAYEFWLLKQYSSKTSHHLTKPNLWPFVPPTLSESHGCWVYHKIVKQIWLPQLVAFS